jgi:hypothetical protein
MTELRIRTLAEEPSLDAEGIPSRAVWPEYNLHSELSNRLWPRLYEELSEFQFGVFDERTGELLAEGHTAPCAWSGRDEDLPGSFDDLMLGILDDLDARRPAERRTALAALAAEVPAGTRSRGLATVLLEAMRDIAVRHGLPYVIAGVRPSWKDRYPITPIERYVRWRREDGLPFDPWLRIHERLGARFGPALPRSLRIAGTVAEWESWTGMAFPESGDYVFPQGLATVAIDREADQGTYWEPNVWMIHRCQPPSPNALDVSERT